MFQLAATNCCHHIFLVMTISVKILHLNSNKMELVQKCQCCSSRTMISGSMCPKCLLETIILQHLPGNLSQTSFSKDQCFPVAQHRFLDQGVPKKTNPGPIQTIQTTQEKLRHQATLHQPPRKLSSRFPPFMGTVSLSNHIGPRRRKKARNFICFFHHCQSTYIPPQEIRSLLRETND